VPKNWSYCKGYPEKRKILQGLEALQKLTLYWKDWNILID